MLNLQTYYFKLDFQKVDQHTVDQTPQGQSVAKPGTSL